MGAKEKLSPMMEHYIETKKDYEDCILFYRLGDFYEMFFDDAKTASKELELTLTGKNCGLKERAPMCGIPFHAAETYIAKLVEKGYKVAICEQMEDPKLAKGIVKREVIKIVTPGTLTSGTMLKENENNYLASVYISKEGTGISYTDISTGELYVTDFKETSDTQEILINELVRISPREIILNEHSDNFISKEDIEKLTGACAFYEKEVNYKERIASDLIESQFGKASLGKAGLKEKTPCILSLGALLSYLLETQKQSLKQLITFQFYTIGQHMALDKATLRNLEITETLYEKRVQGSLLGVLDKTETAMGGRKLKQWLKEPLNNADEINKRLDAVEELTNEPLLQNNIREALKEIYDFERLAGRIGSGNANGRDLLALKKSTEILPELKSDLADTNSQLLQDLNEEIRDLDHIYQLIEDSINEDAPFTIKEGGIIKPGYSKELDDLKFSIKDGKAWIAGLESKERERTGIKTLKVGFNKVFGYYIDVTKANADLVPEDYIRKQTLVNNERYITPELKEMESLVLNAETKINDTEFKLFTEIREEIEKYIEDIQATSRAVGILDVLASFAYVSSRLGYTRPVIDNSYELQIEKGRHPVIEQMVRDGIFVSNDTYLDNKDNTMIIITGPNMSGKSTYMRQTALIVLMAQAGCFVPCEYAHIGVVDRIFTRIGASDNLSMGESTFYVEMSELAYILNCATERSLIILDEIGRGTSTYDGLSIAWATVDYLCNENKHIRTLFATHYHELTALEEKVTGVKNFNVEVSEENGNIVFLHKIIPGSANRSYGLHVAQLAGVPKSLIDNAGYRLALLEEGQSKEEIEIYKDNPKVNEEEQMSFFLSAPDPLKEKIRSLNLMEITPSKAFEILEELKAFIEND